DVERTRISEVITAYEADYESSNVENISLQNGSMIYGKFTDKKFGTNGLLKRPKSASEFTATGKFPTAR
ncbi:hypothetical protein LOAG_14772, partial [Loa loa]